MKIWSDVEYVYRCLADRKRVDAFQTGINAAVKPGDVVLEVDPRRVLERGLGREDGYGGDEAHDLGADVVHQGAGDALERAGKDEEPEDDRRSPADGLPLRERDTA